MLLFAYVDKWVVVNKMAICRLHYWKRFYNCSSVLQVLCVRNNAVWPCDMVWTMCAEKLKDWIAVMVLIKIFSLNEMIDQLANANSIHWYTHVLRTLDRHVLKSSLDIAMKNGRPVGTCESQWGEMCSVCGLCRISTNFRSFWPTSLIRCC